MASRRQWHLSVVSALAAAALLAACGGGDSGPTITRVVSFGDSYSDLGAYTVATQIPLGQAPGVPPFFGGRFTTNTYTGYSAASNTNTATIWVEWVATRLGVAITPAEVGFGAQSVKCPVAATTPALAGSCTAYGQGGALVTDPNGINRAQGFLTVPLVTQVANHLGRFGSFTSSDVVFVFGGANHLLTNFTAVSQGLPPATALANMRTAGTELAALVKNQIVARGATRVAVMNLPDIAPMPSFNQLPAANTALLGQMAIEFNTALTTGLAGVDIRIIDMQALFSDILRSPSKYGFTNVTTAACDPAKMSPATGGSSMFCNASPASAFVAPIPNLNSIRTGASASTWLFADGVHPTTGGHKAIADYVINQLKEFDWIPFNQ